MSVLFDPAFHRGAVVLYFALGVATLLATLFVTAPYGRHQRGGWGPSIDSRVAWLLMESPATLVFLLFFLSGQFRGAAGSIVLLVLWQTHYVQRTFIFPFLIREKGRQMALAIPLLAIPHNLLNAYVNAFWIGHFHEYTAAWLADPRFLVGAALFVAGYVINRWADNVLRELRKPGETTYSIPHGGLYEVVSCPNYLGEILIWVGWAVATWSLPGLAFAFYTVANLLPRALSNHRWYREEFPEYPARRKALIPYVL